MMYWNNGHMGTGWGVVMMLVMLAFWVLVAFAVVRFVRSTETRKAPPEQILAERLARGEIEPEDYKTRLTALK